MRELQEKDGKLDTKSMLESNFFEEYAKEGGKVPKSSGKASPSVSSPITVTPKPLNGNTEELLVDAYETRDSLIGSFKDIQLGSDLANSMKTAINRVGRIIRGLGGEAEEFDPLSHASGLNAPSIDKYASRVIENTLDSYTLGKINDAKLDGNSIIIEFAGSSNNMQYRAIGTITTDSRWLGTEAIDYVYTPGEGKMSVKIANQNGEWIDQIEGYDIRWELFEEDLSQTPQKNIEKSAQLKEEDVDLNENNMDDDISNDFPIEEK